MPFTSGSVPDCIAFSLRGRVWEGGEFTLEYKPHGNVLRKSR